MEFEPENIPADYSQLDIIEALLKTSTISAENNEYWSQRLNTLKYHEAENLIEFLQRKQVNKVLGGFNYNAGYINWFLKTTI
jgi:hypothetical protein